MDITSCKVNMIDLKLATAGLQIHLMICLVEDDMITTLEIDGQLIITTSRAVCCSI